MTDPVEAIVACPECQGEATVDLVPLEVLRRYWEAGLSPRFAPTETVACERCNGTGLVRIRALREDVPTIDRVPKEES